MEITFNVALVNVTNLLKKHKLFGNLGKEKYAINVEKSALVSC